jgi:tellurite resistance protein TehA-like permease
MWKGSDFDVRFDIDREGLVNELKTKVDKLDRSIVYRNIIEITLAIIFLPVFCYLLYVVPYYIFKLGALVMVLWCIILIYKILQTRANKIKTEYHENLISKLSAQKGYLLQEIKLINSVLYWYLLPPFIGQILMIIGINYHRNVDWESDIIRGIASANLYVDMVFILFIVLMYYYIYLINKRSIKKDIKPIIENIDEFKANLSKL